MIENCPAEAVYTNFAGGGSPVRIAIADPNSFQGHTTMWKSPDGDIRVKSCDPAEVVGGSCPESGNVARYPNVYAAHGCAAADCMYRLVSDIWNGYSGDGGYGYCSHGQPHYSSGCNTSVTNIRFRTSPGTFTGKCSAFYSGSPTPSPPTPPVPSPSTWSPCGPGSAVCCNPHTAIRQYCPGNIACQECGGGEACECPSGLMVV